MRDQTEHERDLPEGGPPAELLPNWEDRGRVATTPTHRSPRSSPPLCLAVGGHGGVSGTPVRKVRQSAYRGKRYVGRSPICVWCRRQDRNPWCGSSCPVGNHNDSTSRRRQQGTTLVTRGTTV